MTKRIERYVNDLLKYAAEQNQLDVRVSSAVQLSDEQETRLANKLAKEFNKEINMTLNVDPSLLGGLRIVAGHTVIDNSIKTRIADMKKNIYRGVFFK